MWRCARCEVINKDEDAKCQICGMTASCSQKWTAFLEAEEQRRAAAAEQAEKQKKLDAEKKSAERASEKRDGGSRTRTESASSTSGSVSPDPGRYIPLPERPPEEVWRKESYLPEEPPRKQSPVAIVLEILLGICILLLLGVLAYVLVRNVLAPGAVTPVEWAKKPMPIPWIRWD